MGNRQRESDGFVRSRASEVSPVQTVSADVNVSTSNELSRQAWHQSLVDRLTTLYRNHHPKPEDVEYFAIHGQPFWIDSRVRTFQRFAPFLPESGAILDWGCKHAAECCLLRWRFGHRFVLHGCDFYQPEWYSEFFEQAGLTYRLLSDEVELPYASESFDVVIGSGVLEHAPLDYESLKEIRRILKSNGLVIITYLPNRRSLGEWYRRVIRKSGFHHRLYDRSGIRELLLRAGFYPRDIHHQTYAIERLGASLGFNFGWSQALARGADRLTPINQICSTFAVVAEKKRVM
jgi:SAM-dependent methyltransferase